MTSQNKNADYFLHLLASALNETPVKKAPNGVDYRAVLALAKKHQVYNIIYPVIAGANDLSQADREAWRSYNLSEITRMIAVNSERSQIFEQLKAQKIKFMPLKGLIIKAYYPKESMRQMSDNDILFDASKRDDVARIMKSRGYKTVATGENSDDYFKAPYCTFEFHRNLFFEENAFCPKFDNLWERAVKDSDNEYLYHMGTDDVYIYSVCHMYKHFSTAGCGVRFLADHYLFLKKESDKLDWDYINASLEKFGILAYEQKSRKLAFDIFEEKELEEDELTLLETYMNHGIYGDGAVRLTRQLKNLAENENIQTAKKKYLLSRLFPSRKKMIADYRILEKKPYLLPALYIYRLIKGLFNFRKTVGEVKTVSKIDDK